MMLAAHFQMVQEKKVFVLFLQNKNLLGHIT